MPEKALELRNISKDFAGKPVFSNVSLSVPQGQFLSLVGRSGSGKSTLLRLMAKLESPSSGEISTSLKNISGLSYVFQEAQLLPWKTVLENVTLPLDLKHIDNGEAQSRGFESLKKVGLEEWANHFPHQLSGGMKMRVSLARALITRPQLLLLDEPFGALDENTRFEMQDQLLDLWQKESFTAVFVTHSLFEAAYLSERVVILKGSDFKQWTDLPVMLPARNEELRTSAELNQLVKALSEGLRR